MASPHDREETNRISANGLSDEVEILIDRYGIPHIYAKNTADLFFAQGFNAARDRLFQIDLWRRRGKGRVAEVLGRSHIERDRAARLLLYRGDIDEDWRQYGEDAREIAAAFVDGINAYIELTETGRALLPIEFVRLGYAPGRFEVDDITRIRTNMSVPNVDEEVTRAKTLREFGREAERLRRTLEPPRQITIPEGLDLDAIPSDVLRLLYTLRSPINFGASIVHDEGAPVAPGVSIDGSNNWAVAPRKSATGRAILASDPHRAIALPSLRYIAHLVAPGLDLIGGGEPSLPGISIGHNGKVGFGFTIFSADQEDLYVYSTHPDDPHKYVYGDGYEEMVVVHEELPVRDDEATTIGLVFTRHGPVIYEDPEHHLAFAIRAAWLEPGGAPYLGSLAQMQASSVHELLESLDRWAMPGENFVCADIEGNVAWKPAALLPRRPNWDGLLPVPGDGRYEWDGFISHDDLPVSINPSEGFIATANACEIPPDYPEEIQLGYEWAAPFRRDRIKEVLGQIEKVSIADSLALQCDHVSLPARRVTQIAAALSDVPQDLIQEMALLSVFDGNLDARSPAAGLYEVFYRAHLRPALLDRSLSAVVASDRHDGATRDLLNPFIYGKTTVVDVVLLDRALEELRNGEVEMMDLVSDSLRRASAWLCSHLGTEPAEWSWGRLHEVRLNHVLTGVIAEEESDHLSIGPAPRGGDGDTPGCTTAGADFIQFHGSDFRIVLDVGEWDNSLAMNSPGQSGNPNSVHYRDLFEHWASDSAFPLLYTRAAVEQVTTERIVLSPNDQAVGDQVS